MGHSASTGAASASSHPLSLSPEFEKKREKEAPLYAALPTTVAATSLRTPSDLLGANKGTGKSAVLPSDVRDALELAKKYEDRTEVAAIGSAISLRVPAADGAKGAALSSGAPVILKAGPTHRYSLALWSGSAKAKLQLVTDVEHVGLDGPVTAWTPDDVFAPPSFGPVVSRSGNVISLGTLSAEQAAKKVGDAVDSTSSDDESTSDSEYDSESSSESEDAAKAAPPAGAAGAGAAAQLPSITTKPVSAASLGFKFRVVEAPLTTIPVSADDVHAVDVAVVGKQLVVVALVSDAGATSSSAAADEPRVELPRAVGAQPLALLRWSATAGWTRVCAADPRTTDIFLAPDASCVVATVRTLYQETEACAGDYFIVDLPTGTFSRLTQGAGRTGDIVLFSPDASIIVFAANYSLARPITTASRLFYVRRSTADDGPARLPKPRPITPTDEVVVKAGWLTAPSTHSAGNLYYTVARGPAYATFSCPLRVLKGGNGRTDRQAWPIAACSPVRVALGRSILFASEDAASLGALVRVDDVYTWLDGVDEPGVGVSSVSVPQSEDAGRVRCRLLKWRSAYDDQEIEGALYWDERSVTAGAPLIVWAHGGPAITEPLFCSLGVRAARYMVAHLLRAGYVIFYPHYRGTLGYGDAFALANFQSQGVADAADIASGVKALQSRGVGLSGVGVYGGSYGGYLSLALPIQYPDVFSAAVSWYPFIDNRLTSTELAVYDWEDEYFGGRDRWPVPSTTRASDVLERLSGSKCPTLFLHGEEDDACPLSHSRIACNLLAEAQVPTGLIIYPDEQHGFSSTEHRVDAVVRTLYWFLEHLPLPTPGAVVAGAKSTASATALFTASQRGQGAMLEQETVAATDDDLSVTTSSSSAYSSTSSAGSPAAEIANDAPAVAGVIKGASSLLGQSAGIGLGANDASTDLSSAASLDDDDRAGTDSSGSEDETEHGAAGAGGEEEDGGDLGSPSADDSSYSYSYSSSEEEPAPAPAPVPVPTPAPAPTRRSKKDREAAKEARVVVADKKAEKRATKERPPVAKQPKAATKVAKAAVVKEAKVSKGSGSKGRRTKEAAAPAPAPAPVPVAKVETKAAKPSRRRRHAEPEPEPEPEPSSSSSSDSYSYSYSSYSDE
jgi:dienelactone hydrolase